MKRIFPCLLCLLMLSACGLREENDNGFLVFTTRHEDTVRSSDSVSRDTEIRICWLSYLELNPHHLKTEADYRVYLCKVLQPLQRIGISDLFVQVRPYADAIYPSTLFDTSAFVSGKRGADLPFDYLSVILEEAAKAKMRVHAWINPYRVLANQSELSALSGKTALFQFLHAHPEALLCTDNGVYFQPASVNVQKLILDGVRELLDQYPLAGIHIDDYFYPVKTKKQDDRYYIAYKENGGTLRKEDWRRAQVNALLRGIYRTVHAYGEDLVFSVSPGGNIREDKTTHFADVEVWCRDGGFCDWIVPQLYYGFQNASLPFETIAKQWKTLCTAKKVRLIGGLALYKAGKEDVFAGAGKDEWIIHDDLIAREITALRQIGYQGFALYSAQFVNFQRKACQILETVL